MGDQLINDQDFNSQIYNHVKLIGVEKTVAVKKVGKGEKHVFNQPFMMRAYIEKLMYATKLSNCYIFLVLQQLLRAKENCQLMLHCPKIHNAAIHCPNKKINIHIKKSSLSWLEQKQRYMASFCAR